jgi:hypothetical protein
MGFLEKKVEQTKTPEDFQRLTLQQYHKLWFCYAMSDKQMADMFGVTKKDVKEKRKRLGLTLFKAGMLYVYGGPKYREKTILGKDKLSPTYKEKPKKKTLSEKREERARSGGKASTSNKPNKPAKPKRKTRAEKWEERFRYGDNIPEDVNSKKNDKKDKKNKDSKSK